MDAEKYRLDAPPSKHATKIDVELASVIERQRTIRYGIVSSCVTVSLFAIVYGVVRSLESPPNWVNVISLLLAALLAPSGLIGALWRVHRRYVRKEHRRTVELEKRLDSKRESSDPGSENPPRREPHDRAAGPRFANYNRIESIEFMRPGDPAGRDLTERRASMLFIIIGTLTASLSISYAWWTRVRVIRLRQDLFDERDRLFDLAVELDALDDPAYRAARSHLNAAANAVDVVTFELLVFVSANRVSDEPVSSIPRSENQMLDRAITQALESCAARIISSLLTETISGLVLLTRFRLRGILASLETQSRRLCYGWLLSLDPGLLARIHPVREPNDPTGRPVLSN